ncbi:probable serine/threonine-protein kinase DDB_G0286841 isoform X1 [Anthonomus grandis grandis]|uniref:probable serine/threonine-protein kinase DDB_G0286841 isoform X1 n=1 Tax=Anthonomus grandis grandis TaxID=2921223 RepID=UPI0021658A89|nr:probable serine/threonine-protein kinase DDB_G0286841 isoform X1 [Anthonomus grandis grandis]
MEPPTEIGDWKHLADLGSGSFGVVMLWKNKNNEDFIAVKMCKFQKCDSLTTKQRDRWCQEVDFLKSICHPNIVGAKHLDPVLNSFLNKFNPSKLPLLCMEYCKNGNLRKYITNAPINLCGISEKDLRYILLDISNGLSYLHSKNIVHRDIKPENVVLQYCDYRKGGSIFKIIDLGYAKELNDSTLSFVGTLYYLAPEIFYGQDYDHRVDYWSFGNMVFEIVCGVLPFLPELTPFERYEKIKEKGTDDICIYLSSSGSLVFSSEVKREHFVTSCFKQNIEVWLRGVLQFDPTKRSFSNNLSPFDYLKFILDKKIIEVFYVYKQKFFSYEVYPNTSIGTLKNWIARDAKELKENLYFIWYSSNCQAKSDDNDLIDISLLKSDGISLYVYNREALYTENNFSNVKMFGLKDLFNINFKFHLKSLKITYRQALYYIYTELRILKQLEVACFIIKQHLEAVLDIIKEKFIKTSAEFQKLLSDMGSLINQKKKYLKEASILENIHGFFSSLNWQANGLTDFAKQCNNIFTIKLELAKASNILKSSFDKCDIQSIFDKVNSKGFLALETPSYDVLWNKIKVAVSDTIKQKYSLGIDQIALNYLKKNLATLLWAEKFVLWVDNFVHNHNILMLNYTNLQKECTENECEINSLKYSLNYTLEETNQIIQENREVRCQFANIIQIISKNDIDGDD